MLTKGEMTVDMKKTMWGHCCESSIKEWLKDSAGKLQIIF